MKKFGSKAAGCILAAILVGSVTACAETGGTAQEKGGETLLQAETLDGETKENAEGKQSTETNETKENEETKEEEKINRTHFSDLPKAAKEAGFKFRAIEAFSNEFSFSSFSFGEEQQKDENGQPVGEPVNVVKISYKKDIGMGLSNTAKVTIQPKQEEMVQPVTYASTKEIEGKQVSLTEYILRMVAEDYEMTEEDQKLMDSGKVGFSTDGGATIGDVYFRTMYWEEDGLIYTLDCGEPDLSVEELETLVKEYMKGEYQSAE